MANQHIKMIYVNLHICKLAVNELKMKLTIPFTRRTKYFVTKGLKNLYTENYKILLKEIEEDKNKWKDILCSWIERLNSVKMQVLPKAIYGFITISIKFPMTFFFCKDRTTHPKIHMEFHGNLNSQNSWEKRTKLEDSEFLISKLTSLQLSKQYGNVIKSVI